MWAAYLGWLNASREEKLGSRWDEYARHHSGTAPPQPNVGPMAYLRDIFLSWGRGSVGPMSLVPFTARDIIDISELEGLSKIEGRVLREMSVAYVSMIHRARDPFVICPWDGTDG